MEKRTHHQTLPPEELTAGVAQRIHEVIRRLTLVTLPPRLDIKERNIGDHQVIHIRKHNESGDPEKAIRMDGHHGQITVVDLVNGRRILRNNEAALAEFDGIFASQSDGSK